MFCTNWDHISDILLAKTIKNMIQEFSKGDTELKLTKQ